VKSSLSTPSQQTSFLAASSPNSGDCLQALPISSCGLRLADEAVRIGVGLRLGLPLCVPHSCHCGFLVDAHRLHSFVCKKAPGRPARHHALNDLVARAMVSAGTPVTKEPNGLSRSDGQRPDGLSLVPWEEGKPLTWDVTVVCLLADSYVATAARVAGSAAEGAAACKSGKYTDIETNYMFKPITVESLGPVNASGCPFLSKLGRKLSTQSDNDRETSFLFHRLSVNC